MHLVTTFTIYSFSFLEYFVIFNIYFDFLSYCVKHKSFMKTVEPEVELLIIQKAIKNAAFKHPSSYRKSSSFQEALDDLKLIYPKRLLDPSIEIREALAEPSHISGIAKTQINAAVVAYASIFPNVELQSHFDKQHTEVEAYYQGRLEEQDGPFWGTFNKDDQRIAGYFWLCPVPDNKNDPLKVRQLSIQPDFHRKGIGSELLERAKEIACEHGRDLTLNSAIGSDASEKFYPTQGFHPIERIADRTILGALKPPGPLPHLSFRCPTDLPSTVAITVVDFLNRHWEGRKISQEEFIKTATGAIEGIYNEIRINREIMQSQKLLKEERQKEERQKSISPRSSALTL
jgi:GNAT superfamily N-acetyltransferase